MLFEKRLPNTTVKFPDKVRRLLKSDARLEGHNNLSHIVRRIVMGYYGLIKGGNGRK